MTRRDDLASLIRDQYQIVFDYEYLLATAGTAVEPLIDRVQASTPGARNESCGTHCPWSGPCFAGRKRPGAGTGHAGGGEHEPARAALEESLEILDGQDSYEAARTRVGLGRYWAGCGDPERAASLRREARETFAGLGAQCDLEEVEVLLVE